MLDMPRVNSFCEVALLLKEAELKGNTESRSRTFRWGPGGPGIRDLDKSAKESSPPISIYQWL